MSKVSVVIPCYNYADYLPETVKSCVRQTLHDLEIIIVNDGSPDNTKAVALDLIRQFPERDIRLINQENQGLSASRNNAIQQCAGQYVLPLDADDLMEPEMAEACATLLDQNPDIGVAYTKCRYFGEVNKIPDWVRPYDFGLLCVKNILCYASMYRKEAWEDAGGYYEKMRWGYEDWEFWVRTGRLGWRGRLIDSPLFLHRIHGKTMYAGAFERDLELKARIILNNRACYSDAGIGWAKEVEARGLTEELARNPCWEASKAVLNGHIPEVIKTAKGTVKR